MTTVPPRNHTLAALGVSGCFSVEIDEEDYRGDLVMEIRGRDWAFRFPLTARHDASRMLAFLREQAGRFLFAEIVVGLFCQVPVQLIKDDEYADRFWLRVSQGDALLNFELLENDVAELTAALAAAVEDLKR